MNLQDLLNQDLKGWCLYEAISIVYSDEDGDVDPKSEEFFKITDEAYAKELSKIPGAKMGKVLIITDGSNVLKLASQSISQFVIDENFKKRVQEGALRKLSEIEKKVLGF